MVIMMQQTKRRHRRFKCLGGGKRSHKPTMRSKGLPFAAMLVLSFCFHYHRVIVIAFVLVSPASRALPTPMASSSLPSVRVVASGRIRHGSARFASAEESGGEPLKQTSSSNNNKAQPKRNNINNDKNGKNKNDPHKTTKKGTTPPNSKSSNNNGKSKQNRKQQEVVDPSKQKKREIMDQIKANINNKQGDQKKQKHKQTTTTPPQTRPAPQKRPIPKKKIAKPTQARRQNLDDDDDDFVGNDVTTADKKQHKRRLFLNPFDAGKSLRDTLSGLTTLTRGLPKETKQKYFLDDRLLDGDEMEIRDYAANSSAYIPEVLVVGATGEIGRLVVRRLLLEGRGRFRVRVLVRDLYSQTLNLLGTGVSYCHGDLANVESLEYAVTDVDKIVYVAGAPKPDESDFQRKFQSYIREHDIDISDTIPTTTSTSEHEQQPPMNDNEWEQLASVLEVRSELANQVDCIGMKNLVSAYQNVRHTDYGTSQAAKRSLFKFSEKSNDFDLFCLDDDDDETTLLLDTEHEDRQTNSSSNNNNNNFVDYKQYENYNYEDEDDAYNDGDYDHDEDDDDGDGAYGLAPESRKGNNVVKSQVRWLKNKFHNAVFVGKVPTSKNSKGGGGEASIISSRLRSRQDPEMGIDVTNFAGLILRLVSDGRNYEAFVRTSLYETEGIEYVYEFGTDSKRPTLDNKSKSRFKTIRLAFENFKPIQRKASNRDDDDESIVPPFDGSDVRHLGIRFRSSSNPDTVNTDKRMKNLEQLSRNNNKNNNKRNDDDFQRFYIALSYIKVYRAQPEPEFIYLSDARIPSIITDRMVSHDRKMLLATSADDPQGGPSVLLDDTDLQSKSKLERSPEETYFKYRGEDILVKSGLSYTIIRVAGYNELPTSEASTIDLVDTPTNLFPVSRAEVAQVCVSALLDPAALNKIVYMTKKNVVGKNVLNEEDISAKFEGIPTDVIL